MSTDTCDAAQGQAPFRGRVSLEDPTLIVDSEEDAHAGREHLGMEAFAFDRLGEQLPPGGLVKSCLVVSAHGAYERANALIDRGAPRMGVMFVDLTPLQGQTLASMAEQESSLNYLISLLENPSDPAASLAVNDVNSGSRPRSVSLPAVFCRLDALQRIHTSCHKRSP